MLLFDFFLYISWKNPWPEFMIKREYNNKYCAKWYNTSTNMPQKVNAQNKMEDVFLCTSTNLWFTNMEKHSIYKNTNGK